MLAPYDWPWKNRSRRKTLFRVLLFILLVGAQVAKAIEATASSPAGGTALPEESERESDWFNDSRRQVLQDHLGDIPLTSHIPESTTNENTREKTAKGLSVNVQGESSLFSLVFIDPEGAGFLDLTHVVPVGGNQGATLGAQRVEALKLAAKRWADLLKSDVPIEVEAFFSSELPCNNPARGGVRAPIHDFPGAPSCRTWYSSAVANAICHRDLNLLEPNIGLAFNSKNVGDCGQTWYYGLDRNGPSESLDFVSIAMHELAHGLGFTSFVDWETGARYGSPPMDDAFMTHLFEPLFDRKWPDLTDTERLVSSRNGTLMWSGDNTVQVTGMPVQMFSPPYPATGTAVIHFADESQLMGPTYSGNEHVAGIAEHVLRDVGWNLPPSGIPISEKSHIGALPDVAVDRFGYAHVVWSERVSIPSLKQSIWYTKIGPENTVLVHPKVIFDLDLAAYPSIAVDSKGHAHVVFNTLPSVALDQYTPLIYVHINEDGDVVEQSVPKIGNLQFWDALYYERPSIAMDPTRDLPTVATMVLHRKQNGFSYIRVEGINVFDLDEYGEILAGSQWWARFRDDLDPFGTRMALDPDLTVDSNGKGHVVWENWSLESGRPSGVQYAIEGDDHLNPPRLLVPDGTLIHGVSGPDIDAAFGSPFVDVTYSDIQGEIHWIRLNTSGNTAIPDNVISDRGDDGFPKAVGRRPRVVSAVQNASPNEYYASFVWEDSRGSDSTTSITNLYSRTYKSFQGPTYAPEPVQYCDVAVAPTARNPSQMSADLFLPPDKIDVVWREPTDSPYGVHYHRLRPERFVSFIGPKGDPFSGACTDGQTEVRVRLSNLPVGVMGKDVSYSWRSPGDLLNPGRIVSDLTVNTEKRIAELTYRVPDFFPGGTFKEHPVFFRFTVNVPGLQEPQVYERPLLLARPPVVTLHGLWSNSTIWASMFEHLHSAGFRFLYAQDYHESHASHFEDNRNQAPRGIDTALRLASSQGFLATKVDVVAHSMGGILTRYYIQGLSSEKFQYSEREDIRRFITIGTPHSGSWWGCFLPEFFRPFFPVLKKIQKDPSGGAVDDLCYNSPIIDGTLNGTTVDRTMNVPSHAIVGESHISVEDIEEPWLKLLIWHSPIVVGVNIFDIIGASSDLVVSATSQAGGLDKTTQVEVIEHTTEVQDTDVIERIKVLLSSDGGDLSTNGFKPFDLLYEFPSWRNKSVLGLTIKTEGVFDIVSPGSGEVLSASETLHVSIQGPDIESVLAFTEWQAISSDVSPFVVDLTAPSDFVGPLTLFVLARNTSGAILGPVTRTVTVAPPESISLDSVEFLNGDNVVLETGTTSQVVLLGNYSDGVRRLIAAPAPGVDFGVTNDAVALVGKEGLITAVGPGSCTINSRFGGLTTSLEVTIIRGDEQPVQDTPTPTASLTESFADTLTPSPTETLTEISTLTATETPTDSPTSTTKPQSDLSESQIAYWAFDEGAGSIARDQSGHGQDGTIHEASRVEGKVGAGLEFGGNSDSYVEVPYNEYLLPRSGLTVTAWVKVSGYGTWHSCLAYQPGETPTGDGFRDRCYSLWVTDVGGVHFNSTSAGSGSQSSCDTGPGLYQTGEFVYLAGVIDATAGKMLIYVNGDKASECGYPLGGIREGGFPLRLGGCYQTVGDQSNLWGVLDEVRIFNRPLSQDELRSIMVQTPDPTATPIDGFTPTVTHTGFPSQTPTETPSSSPTIAPTTTVTATPTSSITNTPTGFPSPSATESMTPTNTPTPTFTEHVVSQGVVVTVDDDPTNDSPYVPGVGGNISGATAVQKSVVLINSDSGYPSYTVNIVDTDGVGDTYVGGWTAERPNTTIQQLPNGIGNDIGVSLQQDLQTGDLLPFSLKGSGSILSGLSAAKPMRLVGSPYWEVMTGSYGPDLRWRFLVYDGGGDYSQFTHKDFVGLGDSGSQIFESCRFNHRARSAQFRFTGPGTTLFDCSFGTDFNYGMACLLNYGNITATSCTFSGEGWVDMGGYKDPADPNLGRYQTNALFDDCTFQKDGALLRNFGDGIYTLNNPTFIQTSSPPQDNLIYLDSPSAKLTINGGPNEHTDLSPLVPPPGHTRVLCLATAGTLNLVDCEVKKQQVPKGSLKAVHGYGGSDDSADLAISMNRCRWLEDSGSIKIDGGGDSAAPHPIVIQATNTIWAGEKQSPILDLLRGGLQATVVTLTHCTLKGGFGSASYLITGNYPEPINYPGWPYTPPILDRDTLTAAYCIFDDSNSNGSVYGFVEQQVNGKGNLVTLQGAECNNYCNQFPNDFISRIGDPKLDNAGHLTAGSYALEGAVGSLLDEDVDAQTRPQGASIRDIGADESEVPFTTTAGTLSLASNWIQPVDFGSPTKLSSHQGFTLLGLQVDPSGLLVDTLTIWIRNVLGIDDSDLFNARLYWDQNRNGQADTGDSLISSGTSVLSSTEGVITFTTPFYAQGELLVTADFSNLEAGDELTVRMSGGDVTFNGSQKLNGLIPEFRYVVNNLGEHNALAASSTNSKRWTHSYRSPGGTSINGRFNLAGDKIILGYDTGSAWIYDASNNTPLLMLKDHFDKVRYAGFSSDDSSAVTVTRDGAVYIWDLQTGAQVKSLFSDLLVTAAVPSPDFRKLMVITEGKALLLDLDLGKRLWEYIPGNAVVNAIDYSPDGTRIIVGASDKRAYILNAETGVEVRRLLGHTQEVTAVGFTGDGTKVMTSSTDATVQLWNVASGPPVRTISLQGQQTQGAAVSRDGNLIAMVTGIPSQNQQQQLRVFNPSGLELFAMDLGIKSNGLWRGYLNTLAFNPDSSLVLVTSGEQTLSTQQGTGWGSACCFSSANGDFIRSWGPQGAFEGAVSAFYGVPSIQNLDRRPRVPEDGDVVFYATNRGLQLVPTLPGRPIIDHPGFGRYPSSPVEQRQGHPFGISDDGSSLAWAGFRGSSIVGLQVDSVHDLEFSPVLSNRQINLIPSYGGSSYFSLSPSGGRFSLGDTLFGTQTGSLFSNYALPDSQYQSAFSPDERIWGFAVPSDQSVITARTNDPNATLDNLTDTRPYYPWKILYFPDQQHIGILDPAVGVLRYNMDSGLPVGVYRHTVANDAALSNDGALLLIGAGNSVALFDVKTGRILRYFFPLHSGFETCYPRYVDFVKDDQEIVIAWSWNYVDTYTRTTPVGLEISPEKRTLAQGETQEFRVTVVYDDDTTADVSPQEISTDQRAILNVIPSSAGTVVGNQVTVSPSATGTFKVRVLYRESGTNFTAEALVTVGESQITDLAADPTTLTMNPGVFRSIRYTATFSDGYERDVTELVTLSTQDTNAIEVSGQSIKLNLTAAQGVYAVTGTLSWRGQAFSTPTEVTLYGHKTAWERYHVTAGGYGISGDYSPDGQTLAVGFSSGVVALYKVGITPSQYKLQRILVAHQGQVVFCGYKDASTLVTASDDGTIKEWAADGGNPIPLFEYTHNTPIHTAALDGNQLAFGASTGQVGAYNLVSHSTDWVVPTHIGRVSSVSLSSDRILSGGDDHWVKVLNRSDGSLVKGLEAHAKPILSVGFLGSFRNVDAFFSLGADKQLTLWDNTTFHVIERYEYQAPPTAASFENGKLYVSTTQPVATWIYNSDGLLLRWLDHHPDQGGVKKHLTDPSGQYLLTGRERGKTQIGTQKAVVEFDTYFSSFQFWEIGRGVYRGSLAHSYSLDDAHVTEDGRQMFTQDAKRTMSWFFDASSTSASSEHVFETGYFINPSFAGMDFTANSQILATCVLSSIFMYDTFHDLLWKTLHTPAQSFAISPSGTRLATSDSDETRLWDLTSLTLIRPESRVSQSMDFHSEDYFVGALTEENFCGIWNQNGFLSNGFDTRYQPIALCVNSSGSRTAVVTVDFTCTGAFDCIYSLYLEVFDTSKIAIGEPASKSSEVFLDQFVQGECLLDSCPPPASVVKPAVALSDDGAFALFGSNRSKIVRLIRIADGSTLKEFRAPVGDSEGNQGAAAVQFSRHDDAVLIGWREGFAEVLQRIRDFDLDLRVEVLTKNAESEPYPPFLKSDKATVNVSRGDVLRIQSIARYANGTELNVTSSTILQSSANESVAISGSELTVKDTAHTGIVNVSAEYEEPGLTKHEVISLSIGTGDVIEQTVNLIAGWNLIGWPGMPVGGTFSTMFGADLISAFRWTDFGWNSAATPEGGKGYFVRLGNTQNITLRSDPPTNESVNLDPNWNLISFPASRARGSAPEPVQSVYRWTTFGWNQITNAATLIEPWLGYFVKVGGASSVEWGTGSKDEYNNYALAEKLFKGLNKLGEFQLEIGIANGSVARTLGVQAGASDNVGPEDSELPSSPPGSPEVGFLTSSRLLERDIRSPGDTQTWNLRFRNTPETALAWGILPSGWSFTIQVGTGQLDVMTNGGTAQVPGADDTGLVVTISATPDTTQTPTSTDTPTLPGPTVTFTQQPATPTPTSTSLTDGEFQVDLSIAEIVSRTLGVQQGASDGVGPEDVLLPSAPPETPEVGFVLDTDLLERDIRGPGGIKTWSIRFRNTQEVTVGWGTLPTDWSLTIQVGDGTAIPMPVDGSVQVPRANNTGIVVTIVAQQTGSTETPTLSETPSPTPTQSDTFTPTLSPSITYTPIPTDTVTINPTVTKTTSHIVTETPTTTATPTDTVTLTPTITSTPSNASTLTPTVTVTVTPTVARDYDIWPVPDGDGKIDARDLCEWMKRIHSSGQEEGLIFDFARMWKKQTSG